VWIAACGLRRVDCGVWIAACGLRRVDCGVWIAAMRCGLLAHERVLSAVETHFLILDLDVQNRRW
jgi:hypothetical protein